MPPKINRRTIVKAAVAAVVAPPVAVAHVVEPESEIRPSLPFSEEQALSLLRPTAQPTKGD